METAKRSRKQLLSLLLILAMLVTNLTPAVLAADPTSSSPVTVRVDAVNGDDSYTTIDDTTIVRTLDRAYELLNVENPVQGIIDISGDLTIPQQLPSHAFPVTLTSFDGSGNLVVTGDTYLNGDTTIENITITNNGSKTLTYVVAQCNPLTIGEGVICVPRGSNYLNLVGGNHSGNVTGDSSLTIKSGIWNNVYGGSYQGTQTGSTNVVVSGGTITTLSGGGYSSTITVDVHVTITGGKITGTDSKGIYAATIKGSVDGNVSLAIKGDPAVTIAGTVYGGSRESAGSVGGNTTVSISNATLMAGATAGSKGGTVAGSTTLNLGTDLYLGGGATTADTFTGGGTLTLAGDASLKVTGTVSNTTTVKIENPINNTVCLTVPSAAANSFTYSATGGTTLIPVTENGNTSWTVSTNSTTPSSTFTLTIKVPENTTDFLVFSTYYNKSGTSIKLPSYTTSDGFKVYTLTDPKNSDTGSAAGVYSYRINGEGYYNICRPFVITQEDVESGSKELVLDLVPMAETKWETLTTDSGTTRYVTDEIAELFSTDGLSIRGETYEDITTPALSNPNKAADEYTTQAEMMDFISDLSDTTAYMHVYTLGTTEYGHDIPLVLFTTADIPETATLEEAAAIVTQTGKPIVQYTAQIHGNECSGGEGALTTILAMADQYDATFDEEAILDGMELYIIPRVNPDGSEAWVRRNPTSGDDMNRDHLLSLNPEIQMIHSAYNLFQPEVAIDGHEFSGGFTTSGDVAFDEDGIAYYTNLDDVRISGSGSLNSDAAINAECNEMVYAAFEDCLSSGLRFYDYGSTVANVNGRAYYGLLNSYSFLIETRGIYLSKAVNFERCVFAQYTAVKALLEYVEDNADSIVSNVERARAESVENGRTYSEDDVLVLQSSKSRSADSGYTVTHPSYYFDGTVQNANKKDTFYYYDTPVRTRVSPTAYVFSKDWASAETVKRGLELSGAEVFELPEETTLELQQYYQATAGSDEAAALTETQEVTFAQGAYIVTMDQACAMAIAMTLEPDVTDTTAGCSLVEKGILTADDSGYYPLYRYIEDDPRTALGLEEEEETPTEPTEPSKPADPDNSNHSSSSGGSSTSVSYSVSVSSSVKHGSISVTPKNASRGGTVTITVTPDNGYELENVTVTDANGKSVKVTEGKNGKYTFIMPASKVTVNASFAQISQSAEPSGLPFSDVSFSDWFAEAVKYVYEQELMAGITQSAFAPNGTLTRAMVAQVLYNYDPSAQSGLTNSFADVAPNAWYSNAVSWAAYWGIVSGYGSGVFGPEDNVTREQLATILYNYAKLKGYDTGIRGDLSQFTDASSISSYAVEPMSWAVGSGLLSGMGGSTLAPTGSATRAQVAQIMMSFVTQFANKV